MKTEDKYKKIWYDTLRKSKGISKNTAERFFIADNIDPLKFKENHDYYVMDRYGDHKPTPSCFHPLDAPMAYPYWFDSAYPDVVKFFSNMEDEDLMKIFEDMGLTKRDSNDIDSDSFDQERHFTLEVLYKLKEHYKKLHPDAKLECQ